MPGYPPALLQAQILTVWLILDTQRDKLEVLCVQNRAKAYKEPFPCPVPFT